MLTSSLTKKKDIYSLLSKCISNWK